LDNRTGQLEDRLLGITSAQIEGTIDIPLKGGNFTLYLYPNGYISNQLRLALHSVEPKTRPSGQFPHKKHELRLPHIHGKISLCEHPNPGFNCGDLSAILLHYATLLPTFRVLKEGEVYPNHCGLRAFRDSTVPYQSVEGGSVYPKPLRELYPAVRENTEAKRELKNTQSKERMKRMRERRRTPPQC